jgi:type II secretory pathway predicted ATPase ExeA
MNANLANLATLKERLELSLRELSEALGGAQAGFARTTVHRLCSGERVVRPPDTPTAALKDLLKRAGMDAITPAQLWTNTLAATEENVMHRRTTLSDAAVKFFQMTRDPFSGHPESPEEVWLSKPMESAASRLIEAAKTQKFLAVIGGVGSGKTTISQLVQHRLGTGKTTIIRAEAFDRQQVTANNVAAKILRQFGIAPPSDSVARRDRALEALERQHRLQNNVCLLFDEAQDLSDRTLITLKEFAELSVGFARLLGVILIGNPELSLRIQSDVRFSKIFQRLTTLELPELTAAEVAEYAQFRLRCAGATAQIFTDEALAALAEAANTPLAVGNLCNAVLAEAARKGERRVTGELLASLNLSAYGVARSTQVRIRHQKIA